MISKGHSAPPQLDHFQFKITKTGTYIVGEIHFMLRWRNGPEQRRLKRGQVSHDESTIVKIRYITSIEVVMIIVSWCQ